jgi:hypothetical protein
MVDETGHFCLNFVTNSGRVQLNVSVPSTTADISAGLNSLSLSIPVVVGQVLLAPLFASIPTGLAQPGLGLVYAKPGPLLKIQTSDELPFVVPKTTSLTTYGDADVVQPFPIIIAPGLGQMFYQGVQGP